MENRKRKISYTRCPLIHGAGYPDIHTHTLRMRAGLRVGQPNRTAARLRLALGPRTTAASLGLFGPVWTLDAACQAAATPGSDPHRRQTKSCGLQANTYLCILAKMYMRHIRDIKKIQQSSI